MKCIRCGRQTKGNRIICYHCRNIDSSLKYLNVHTCKSFAQEPNAPKGYCRNFLMCQPIKAALKGETLIDNHLGHVVCPYPHVNLSRIIYKELPKEKLKINYKECLE